jgi:choline dehydrogenase-like flavoprotein
VKVVIGSGPAGVACARRLADDGERVTILDIGREPNEERVAKYAPLSAEPPEEWDDGLVEELRAEFAVSRDELPLKPVLGSLHPYAPEDPSAPTPGSGVGITPSHGRGGLSAVWGAAVLPYRASDLAGWPIALDALAPFYSSVTKLMPLAARRDRLEREFPLYLDQGPADVEPTPQIRAFLDDLDGGAERLDRQGILAGRARLAVRPNDGPGGRGCRRTGLCLHGCPLGAIWSAGQALAELASLPNVRYVPQRRVERFEEGSGAVTITSRTPSGDEEEVRAERLFVAAGVLPTTRLVLRSLDAAGQPVELCDSQYYTFPLLRARGAEIGLDRLGNTLAQAFLELNDKQDPGRAAHLQVYGYSDLMLREAAATLHLPPATLERLARPLLSRLLFCQGYLHSDRSRRIRAELAGAEPGQPLRLAPLGSEQAVRHGVDAVLARLRRAAGPLRAVPLSPLLRVWEPGRGIHVGGSFPMDERPSGLQADLLGRPAGLRRVHLVDSSVFPSVPPTTITFTAMANAQRIAAGHAED